MAEPTARDRAAEALADAVEDYAFTTDRDEDKLRAAWQAYVEAVDDRPGRALAGDAEPSPGACPDCERDRADGRWNLCPLHEIDVVPAGGSAPAAEPVMGNGWPAVAARENGERLEALQQRFASLQADHDRLRMEAAGLRRHVRNLDNALVESGVEARVAELTSLMDQEMAMNGATLALERLGKRRQELLDHRAAGGSAPHQGATTDSLRSRLAEALGLMPGLSDDELVSGASFVREAADGFATRLAATERERDQGATTDVTEVDRLRSGISSLLQTIDNDVPCTFWACEGPDAGLIAMKTCRVCAAVIEVRALLGAGETTEADQ